MKHSPGQGSLHRGKFHPDEEHTTKTPTSFKRMLSAQPILKFSSSDTQKMASILFRENIRLLLGIYFQRANVESKVHQHHICGSYTCPWGCFPTLRADPHRKTCQFFTNSPELYFQCCQNTDFNSSCVAYAFSLPTQRAGQSCPDIWVLVWPAESSVFTGFISHCNGLCWTTQV